LLIMPGGRDSSTEVARWGAGSTCRWVLGSSGWDWGQWLAGRARQCPQGTDHLKQEIGPGVVGGQVQPGAPGAAADPAGGGE